MITFRSDKKLRRKKMHKDFRKRMNILNSWRKEQFNRKLFGLKLRGMPIELLESRKFTKSKEK